MDFQVERLDVNDYEEMLDFINLVFSMAHRPHDFIDLLPAYYQPTEERMKCHWVIRQKGRIRALVGVYPTTLHAGSRKLKIAGIGAVSTHPQYRGRRMMSTLMTHIVEWMDSEHIQLSELGGRRQRYGYFGYEKCGIEVEFQLNAGNIKHTFRDEPPVHLTKVEVGDRDLISGIKGLHDRQVLRCERPLDQFYLFGHNWQNQLLSVKGPDDACIGYLVCDRKKSSINEITVVDNGLAVDAVRAFMAGNPNGTISIRTGAHRAGLIRELGSFCESMRVRYSANWRVMDWASVTEAFIRLKAGYSRLQDGAVAFGIDNIGTLEVTIKKGEVSCGLSEMKTPGSFPALLAQRILFGPLHPDYVADLPHTLDVLRSWCPLPLYINGQDGA